MALRFYLDEHLSETTAKLARGSGLDVVSVDGLGRKGWSDERHPAWAAQEGRVLVTHDAGDYIALTHRFESEGSDHAGILCLPPSFPANRFAQIARALVAYSELHP